MRLSLSQIFIPFLGFLVACGPGSDPVGDDDDDHTVTDTDSDTDTDTTDTSTSTTTEEYDCSQQPTTRPTRIRKLDNMPSTEDFTFDDQGNAWGVSSWNQALVKTPMQGQMQIILPNVSSWGRGTRFMLDGDLVIAEPDSGALVRVDLAGPSASVLLGGLASPNGIAIGMDGFVQATQADGRVIRVDPSDGSFELLFDTPVSTDGITFAPDYRTLYWNSESGEITKVVLDDDGNIIEGPSLFANISGGWDLLDGMTSDACGNLYVVKMGGQIVKVTPDGDQQMWIDVSGMQGGSFISAVNFGSGFGGFEKTNLYIMSLDSGMFEVEMEIEGRKEPHLP